MNDYERTILMLLALLFLVGAFIILAILYGVRPHDFSWIV